MKIDHFDPPGNNDDLAMTLRLRLGGARQCRTTSTRESGLSLPFSALPAAAHVNSTILLLKGEPTLTCRYQLGISLGMGSPSDSYRLALVRRLDSMTRSLPCRLVRSGRKTSTWNGMSRETMPEKSSRCSLPVKDTTTISSLLRTLQRSSLSFTRNL